MNNKVYIVAELGINHIGDINIAKELIDKAHKAGCDAIKLQKREIDICYSKGELDSPRESPFGTTFFHQKEGLEFSIEQYKELEIYVWNRDLDFIVSCWDKHSVDLIEANCNIDYHKVASPMLTDKSFLNKLNFLNKLSDTGKPIILSTGMSTEKQIDDAIKSLKNLEYILACTSTYPTVDSEVNLNYITTLKKKYPQYQIGFSNHSSGLMACWGAVALGAEMIEFHITKDRTMYGSDQAASIENVEQLVSGIRKMEQLLGDGKKIVYESEIPIIKKLRKSL